MAKRQQKTERIYVKVASEFDSTGYMLPTSITWADGRTFPRVDIGLYPISRYNRRIDAGYLHFCPINITFKWVMNKAPRKMYKTKRPPMYKSAVIKSYIS